MVFVQLTCCICNLWSDVIYCLIFQLYEGFKINYLCSINWTVISQPIIITMPEFWAVLEFLYIVIMKYKTWFSIFRVLVFPVVNSYHRFLIHKVAEGFSELHSFSIGQGDTRRTVITKVQRSVIGGHSKDSHYKSSEVSDRGTLEGQSLQKFRGQW
jgi:hypothetical protein